MGEELPEEGRGMDFLEYLGPDNSTTVFRLIEDPADLARASVVSLSWRRFIIENQFSRNQCLRVDPEIPNFLCSVRDGLRPNASAEFEKLDTAHRVYMQLSHSLLSPCNTKNCIAGTIDASSTNSYPREVIQNTLTRGDRHYWSSSGHRDPAAVAEFLIYRLQSDLCLIDEIMVQPAKAYFRDGEQIRSAQRIRFQMGCQYKPLWFGGPLKDFKYIWTYTSPEFTMLQENGLQSFKLPHPVLFGGVVKIELLGGVVKDAYDGCYYICVSHVQVVGKPLSPELRLCPLSRRPFLSYHVDGRRCDIPDSESSGDDGNSKCKALRRGSGTMVHAIQQAVRWSIAVCRQRR